MSGISDTATITLNVNGAQAKQMMSELEAKIKSTEAHIQTLKANMADPKDVEKARKQLRTYQKQLDEMKSASEGVGRALRDLDTATPRQLEKALRTLNRQLKDMTPGTEVWKSHTEKITEIKTRLKELKEAVQEQKSVWDGFKGWAQSAWPALDLLNQWGGSIYDVMRSAVEAYAEMDQEMANVRKFTGMTADQVSDLNEEFKKIDTRTSREDLNKLAQEAGRLGKQSKDDVLGFVRAADQINVALDDLGEGATLTLSKLTGIFGDEAKYGTEQSLLKVGSVINELSQNCSASAPYLAEFASRLGGVGSQAGLTIPQIMGFGAVLDSNAQKVEASATAVSQIIVRMMQEPAKYAKVAGLDVQKFSDMLKRDVNGALILFLEKLQKAGGMDTLSPMFADMGENGSRAIAALSTLATHIDDLKAQQREANKAFQEGTSVTKEFEVQNTTVQAAIEKAKKAVNELRVELGERLSPLMSHLVSSSSAIIRAMVTLVKFIMDNKSAILSLTAGIAAYTIAANAAAIKTAFLSLCSKTLSVALATERAIILVLTSVFGLLSGNITRATAAFKLFSVALKANPIGLVVGAITTAVAAFVGWISKAREATKAERELAKQRAETAREFRKGANDISKSSADYAKNELDRLKKLYDATQNQTKSIKERIAAVNQLQKTYPSAFGNLSREKILAGEASSAYNNLAKNIIKAARAKAAAEKIKENEKQLLNLEMEREDISQSISEDSEKLDLLRARRKSRSKAISRRNALSFSGPSKREKRQLAEASNAIETLNENLDASAERLEEIIMQTSELTAANERLAKKAEDAGKNAGEFSFEAPDVASAGLGYTSQTKAEKEKRKADAEARREAAKGKKEFKDSLNAIKAQKLAADKEVLAAYRNHEIDYEMFLRRRHENESTFYEDSLKRFEESFADRDKYYLDDDKDYQKLLLDREKADEKYMESYRRIRIEGINRLQSALEMDVQHEYEVTSNPTVNDEVRLQARLYQIRKKALEDKKALYAVGSKEYADIEYQMSVLETDRELRQKKLYFKTLKSLESEYAKKSAAEKFELEKATLDALLKAKILTAEQYEKYLKAIAGKYKQELPGQSDTNSNSAAKAKYEEDTKALKSALAAQLLTQQEFNERMASLDKERREKMLAGLRETGGEWNAMLVDVYTSFATMLEGLDGPLENTLANIANCASTISSVVGSAMQIATEFAKAEAEIQINAIEKRYDKEIENAQGNSYKVAKLEKEKEKKIAKIKTEATKKQYQMQVIQAISQSVIAGLNAYASTLAIPLVGPILAPAAMAVALAMGATQVALLKKQQKAAEAQGYSKGGFTKPGAVDEPAGIVHAGEWVASQKLLASPVARPMIEALDYAQRTNTIGSLSQEDVSRSIRANDSLARIAESDGSSALMVAAVAQNAQAVAALTSRLREPFVTVNTVTGDRGIKAAQEEYDKLIANVTPKSKRK